MAGAVLRNGPANVRRMNLHMKSSEILPCSVIHLAFSRTARRSIPAIAHFSETLSVIRWLLILASLTRRYRFETRP
jgi:hypothetical protein